MSTRPWLPLLLPILVCACRGDDTPATSETGDETAGDGDGDGDGLVDVQLDGAVAKGPFLLGSSVDVAIVDAQGNPTGQVFAGETKDDLGSFSIPVIGPGFVAIEATGFYYNEVTADLSDSFLTLRGYYELGDQPSQAAYVNLVTHLVYGRVRELIGQDLEFASAVADAEAELQAALGVGVVGFEPGVNGFAMNLLGGDSDANAYLFAVSTVLAQVAVERAGGPDGPVEARLQELVNTLADQLTTLGQIAPSLRDELLAGQTAIDPEGIMAGLQARFDELGWAEPVPDLNRVIDSDLDGLANADDNCRMIANADQADADQNGIGDACECGNGVVDFGEACDDGDEVDDNACSNTCALNCVVVATVQASAVTPLTVVGERVIYSTAAGTWGYALGEAPELLIESEGYYGKTGSAGAVVYTVDGIFGTDGTAQGTELLLEGNVFWSGATFDGRVLFGDNSDGIETWASDGTLAGTELLFTGPVVETSTQMNGALYFRTTSPTHELWVSDGTQAGTSVVYTFGGDPGGWQQDMATLADDLLVMTDADGLVWTSDGTALGTVAVGAPPRIAGGDEQQFGDGAFVVADGVALFTGVAAGTDAVWRTDGTLAGTYELLQNAWIQPFIPFAGDIYFAHINQLWRSDGTVPGTVETGLMTEGLLGPAGGRLFYWSAGNLWSTDGTVEGAREVFAFAEFQGLPGLVVAGSDSIWWSFQGLGEQLLAGCRVPQ